LPRLPHEECSAKKEEFMRLPHLASAVIITVFLPAVLMHAAENASCTFNTFSAPSGYTLSDVNGVSDDGTVVGQLVDNKTLESVAFTYSASGVFTKYTAPKSSNTWMYGRNGSGLNAGSYQDSAYPGHIHGFLWQGNQFTVVNYPKASNSWVFDVNQLGDVVGSFSDGESVTKGFSLVNGRYTTIAYPKAQTTYAQAINNNGAVVGAYSSSSFSNGFLWQNGTFTTINYPNSPYGTALAGVNNSGVIVDNHFSAEDAFGFLYENGAFENIVYTGAGAKYTATGGINNNGLISGQIYFKGGKILGYTAVCK
jgi:probable HAF family extracellular repeat protein